jgi:hypothetical protein
LNVGIGSAYTEQRKQALSRWWRKFLPEKSLPGQRVNAAPAIAKKVKVMMRSECIPGVWSFSSDISAAARISRAAQILVELERHVFFQVRDDLHALHRLRNAIEKRAEAIASGARLRWTDEVDFCHSALLFVKRETTRADAAYLLVRLAAPTVRAAFALRPTHRSAMVAAALRRGFVADARGYRFEVLQ